MTKYESTVKQVHYPQASIFAKLADMSNLETIKQRAAEPEFIDRLRA